MTGHSFQSPSGLKIRYCVGCGLIPLKNWITQMCVRLGCGYKESAQFVAWEKGGKRIPENDQ